MEQIKAKIESLNLALAEAIKAAASPALLWSGGIDSTLLLFLALNISREKLTIIQFRADLRPAQLFFSDSIIRANNLTVLTYQPAQRFFIPGGENLTLVSDYSIGRVFLPVLRDCIEDENFCAVDLYKSPKTEFYDFPFDTAIIGWRGEDRHSAFGDLAFPAEVNLGHTRFVAPLIDWTREEVNTATEFLGIPKSEFYKEQDELLDTGSFVACHRCIDSPDTVFCPKVGRDIQGSVWDKQTALENFQQRFN